MTKEQFTDLWYKMCDSKSHRVRAGYEDNGNAPPLPAFYIDSETPGRSIAEFWIGSEYMVGTPYGQIAEFTKGELNKMKLAWEHRCSKYGEVLYEDILKIL